MDHESQGFKIDTEALGRILAECIKDADLEHQEFADRLGISANTISNYVNGRLIEKQFRAVAAAANLGREQAVKILDALQIAPQSLEGVGGGMAETFTRATRHRDDPFVKNLLRLVEDRIDELEGRGPPGGERAVAEA